MMLLRQSTHRMIVRHDPDIGFLYVPNLNARIPNEAGGYYVRTNSLGFRSDSEFREARSDRPRILFFGDSYTAGDGCDNRDRFPERLGRELGVEVYNYGMSGTGTDQQVLIFERFAHAVEADLIVLGIQVENLQRIIATHRESIHRVTGKRVFVPKPYFTFDADRLRLNNVPVPLERLDVDTRRGFSNGREHWVNQIIRLYRKSPLFHKAGRIAEVYSNKVRGHFLRRTGFQPYAGYTSADHDAWKLMQAIIKRLHADVSPIPLLIVPIPNYYFYLHGVEPSYQALFNSLEDREGGLHVSDLTSRLIALPMATRERLSFQHDSHFSPYGHEQVARLIQEDIVSRRLLLPRSAVSAAGRNSKQSSGRKSTYVLGLSCFYHDSAAALIKDGKIVAAAEEERFSRIKNDRRFPHHAANYCLEEAGIQQHDLSAVVYYDNASLTFERLMHTLLALAPDGEQAWLRMLPSWIRHKLHLPELIRRALHFDGPVLQDFHHRSHAASAFYPSPFERAAVLTVDGVGEWGTASIAVGAEHRLRLLKEMRFPHSLGLLYSAFTQFTGFKVNDGEYKMMGLAPYGAPKYVDTIRHHLVDLKQDGSVQLNLDYFAFLSEPTMTNHRFAELFGGPARKPESRITQREMDLARSIQAVTEEAILRMANHARQLTGERNLCLAGGVALNCVANGRLLREGPFDRLWIQPAAGDAGGALGAALDAYHCYFDHARETCGGAHGIQGGSYWGPEFGDDEIEAFLKTHGYPHRKLSSHERSDTAARLLEIGQVVGHFSGRAEFGPRALGARSILGDARNSEMQVNLNLKIKYRESFRPFAPTVLVEKATEYFELNGESPYMLVVAPVQESRRKPLQAGLSREDLLPIVRQQRSDIPAVTHVDYSARIQTLKEDHHRPYYQVIKGFEERTGCPVVVNTSFNVRGEPIVCTPYDAYRCFMRTDMDALILGNYLLVKAEQPEWPERKGHLEKQDRSVHEEVPRRFLKGLSSIYRREFLAAARSLGKNPVPHIFSLDNRISSTWSDFTEDQSPKAVFSIPVRIDSTNPSAEIMAQSIVEFWTPGPITDVLRPVLVSLIKLGRQFPASESLEEDVSQSAYVMF